MTAKRCYNKSEAIAYLGIKRKSFDKHILPSLTGKGIRIGTSVVFEVQDLDAAWEKYKIAAGGERPDETEGDTKWDAPKHPAFTGQKKVTTLTSITKVSGFDSAASRILNRQKAG